MCDLAEWFSSHECHVSFTLCFRLVTTVTLNHNMSRFISLSLLLADDKIVFQLRFYRWVSLNKLPRDSKTDICCDSSKKRTRIILLIRTNKTLREIVWQPPIYFLLRHFLYVTKTSHLIPQTVLFSDKLVWTEACMLVSVKTRGWRENLQWPVSKWCEWFRCRELFG